jgi:hypothetical protein
VHGSAQKPPVQLTAVAGVRLQRGKHMNRIFVAVFILLFSVGASSAERYLCIASSSTGYAYDNAKDDWGISEFKTDDKYIVFQKESDKHATWRVKSFDESHVATCKDDFSAIGKLYCSGLHTFQMNKLNGRFIMSYMHGYWDDGLNDIIQKTDKMKLNPFYDTVGEEGKNTPYMQIGECTSL